MTCERCGQVHAKCKAHTRAGKPCRTAPVIGQAVCRMHGGSSPQAKSAAARRQEERAAVLAVETLGLPRDISPTDALLEEVRWTAGHVQWLRAKVQDLQEDDLEWQQTKETTGVNGGTTHEAKPSIWYALYTNERAHLVKVTVAAITAGIEERRVRIAESQGALVADVIRRILAELQLTPGQQELVATVVPRQLRALAGAA